MRHNQIKDKVRELASASNLNAAMNPSGVAAEILGLGDGAVRAIQDSLENPQGSCGTLQVNVLVLALKMFADAGNGEAVTLLHSVADGKIKSLSLLGPQGNADIAMRIARNWEQECGGEAISSYESAEGNIQDTVEEDLKKVKLGMTLTEVAKLIGPAGYRDCFPPRVNYVWRMKSEQPRGLYISFESNTAKGIATLGETTVIPRGSLHNHFNNTRYRRKILRIVNEGRPTEGREHAAGSLGKLMCRLHAHSWSGCKCKRCGKLRDEGHTWEGCKCTICEKTRDTKHSWSGESCARCGKEKDKLYFCTAEGKRSVVELVEVMFVGIDIPAENLSVISEGPFDDIIPRFCDMGQYKMTRHNVHDASSAVKLIRRQAAQRKLNVLITPTLQYDPELSWALLGRSIHFILGIMTTVAKGEKPNVVVARSEADLCSVLSLGKA